MVLNMDQRKQSTTCDCDELEQPPPGGQHVTEGSTVSCNGGERPPPKGVTVEQPAGRAEAQLADSTCNHSNKKHLNVSVSKTRATGGIRRGVLDTALDSVKRHHAPRIRSESRSVEGIIPRPCGRTWRRPC